jgi:hypothetical protein
MARFGGGRRNDMGLNSILVTLSILISGILVVALAPTFVGYCMTTAENENITGTVTAIIYNLILPILWGVIGVVCIVAPMWKLWKS